jgi:hypothetical protein
MYDCGQNEQLQAMKEDITDWINRVLDRQIVPEKLIDVRCLC